LKICERLEKKYGPTHKMRPEKIDRLLRHQLKSSRGPLLGLFRKENPYSSIDFRYIKFICRKMIKIQPQSVSGSGQSVGKEFSFFYPFEVQIMDKEAFSKMQSGDTDHTAYKDRQIEAAKKRILP